MIPRRLPACLFLLAALAVRPAAAAADPGWLERLWRGVWQSVEQAAAERTRRPPVPVAVVWRERRIASVDLGGPLLALTAVDVDRDGRAELAALTTEWLILLAPSGKSMREVGRAALPGGPPAIGSRDPVGTLVADGRGPELELLARSSERAEGVALVWRDGALREARRLAGFPLCEGAAGELVPGRNYFDGAAVRWDERAGARFEPPAEFFSAVCRSELRDRAGQPLWASAVVDTERIVRTACRAVRGPCPEGPATGGELTGAGVAMEVADIDNDGSPELIVTRGGAPGERDRVSVHGQKEGRAARLFSKEFQAGVVGLAAGDLDGDGDRDLVVAVRFVGSHHVSFWTLN